jgi:O-methyltransferase
MSYVARKLKKVQQSFTSLLQDSAFFMQGQMDIHPNSRWFNEDLVQRTGGLFPKNSEHGRHIKSLEPWDNTRRDMIILLLRTIVEKEIEGDFVELGVYKGFTARLMHHYAPERVLHLFDTFEGFPDQSMQADKDKADNPITKKLFKDTSVEGVKKLIFPQNDNVHFYPGFFPDTIPEGFNEKRFSFVHLDADLYEPVLDGLKFFYDRMSPGGFILVHDYNAWIGARQAVDEFFKSKKEIPIPMPDKSGSALIQKQ